MPLSWHGMATAFAPENSTEPGDHRKWVSQRKNTVGKWAEELLGWADCSSKTQASKQITAVTDYNPNFINRIKTPKSKLTINLKKNQERKESSRWQGTLINIVGHFIIIQVKNHQWMLQSSMDSYWESRCLHHPKGSSHRLSINSKGEKSNFTVEKIDRRHLNWGIKVYITNNGENW